MITGAVCRVSPHGGWHEQQEGAADEQLQDYIPLFGFAGLRFAAGEPQLNPRLPGWWTRLAFSFWYRGKKYCVDIGRGDTSGVVTQA